MRTPEQIKATYQLDLLEYRLDYVNRLVRLKDNVHPKKAAGRYAIISDVSLNHLGDLVFCCIVLRSDGNPENAEKLNSAAWTRTFRTIDQFDLVDDRRYSLWKQSSKKEE